MNELELRLQKISENIKKEEERKKALNLEKIVEDMKDECIQPKFKFTAKAGKALGYVEAYPYGDEYIIVYGDEVETFYELSKDVEDLASYLLGDCESHTLLKANIRGADFIDEASESDEGPFYILETRYWNDGTETSDYLCDWSGNPILFYSYKKAKKWIKKKDKEIYYLSHNESDRPTYKIVNYL